MIESLILGLAMVAAALAAMITVRVRRRAVPGFGWWIAALAVFIPGLLAVALRGPVPLVPSVILGNLLLMLAYVLAFEGLVRFYGHGAWWRWLLTGAGFAAAYGLIMWHLFVVPDFHVRTVGYFAFLTFMMLRAVPLPLRSPRARSFPANWGMALVLLVLALINVGHLLTTVMEGAPRGAMAAVLTRRLDLWGVLIVGLTAAGGGLFLVRGVLFRSIQGRLAARGQHDWVAALDRRRVVGAVSLLALVLVFGLVLDVFGIWRHLVLAGIGDISGGVRRLLGLVQLGLGLFALDRLLLCVVDVYDAGVAARQRPVKNIVEFARIFLWVIGAILFGTLAAGESVWGVLGSIGAFSAVLMFLFRSTIESFIGGLQLSSSRAVRIGDWIESRELGLDGDVIDVSLHMVRIRNFDKTVSSVPTWRLANASFKNWRGMEEFGGRRFKRAVMVDKDSVRFVTRAEITRLRDIDLLRDFVDRRLADSAAPTGTAGTVAAAEAGGGLNRGGLTNVDCYEAYLRAFLAGDARIHAGGTCLVRQRPPVDTGGLPIEVYAFLTEVEWAAFERISAEMYAHFVAAASFFDLRIHHVATPAGNTSW